MAADLRRDADIDDLPKRRLQVAQLVLGQENADLQGLIRRVVEVAVHRPGAKQRRCLNAFHATDVAELHGIAEQRGLLTQVRLRLAGAAGASAFAICLTLLPAANSPREAASTCVTMASASASILVRNWSTDPASTG